MDRLIQLALDEGFEAAALVDTDQIVFDPAFRPYCEQNLCGKYGANYSCPPDCGTPQEMEARMRGYARALVVQTKWDIPDWHDAGVVTRAKRSHNNAMLRIIDRLRAEGYDGVMGGASCCTLCERCAILDKRPCPQPERRFSCLSAYCVYVKKLADACGMEYACADGRVAFFGLFAFNAPETASRR